MLFCKQTPGKNVQLVIRPSENAAIEKLITISEIAMYLQGKYARIKKILYV